ncbi:MAG: RNA polymerase sigma factor [Acidimicrobiia bacterium]
MLLYLGERSERGWMLSDETRVVSFTEFVEDFERPLWQALTSAFGPEVGGEASCEALAYGWEHWDRVAGMGNPGGYLYRVGYDRARRMKQKRLRLPLVDVSAQPWVEPGLPDALADLPETQRTVVGLVHGYQWTLGEVAEYLEVSKGTVQTHLKRGLAKLRRELGVDL